MCCRYYVDPSNPELLSIAEAAKHAKLMERFRRSAAEKLDATGKICPSMIVPVIARNKEGETTCFPMKWGYSMAKKHLLVNARMETAAEKPMFCESWKSHRCIVPASYYYEWEHIPGQNGKKGIGDKYLLQPKGAKITWLCGLYRMEDGLPHFVILTRTPGREIASIHDRMPLIVDKKDIENWINPEVSADSAASCAITELYFQKTG